MASSPTQRSLKHFRDMGFACGITEKWNQFAGIRQDLYGFIDLVAMREGEGIIGVQTTSYPNVPARMTKIHGTPAAAVWLASGGRIIVHGWHKVGHRWRVREEEITEITGGNPSPEKETEDA